MNLPPGYLEVLYLYKNKLFLTFKKKFYFKKKFNDQNNKRFKKKKDDDVDDSQKSNHNIDEYDEDAIFRELKKNQKKSTN